MNLDPTTLAVGAAVGGGVGTLAALAIVAIIVRYVFRLWQDFDTLRTAALVEMRAENADLRKRVELLESALESANARRRPAAR